MSSPYLFFIRCFLFSFSRSKEETIAIQELLYKKSLRCEYNKKKQWLSPLRNFISSAKILFIRDPNKTPFSETKFAWIYFSKNQQQITDYLKFNYQSDTKLISQEKIKNNSTLFKILVNLIQLFLVFVVIQSSIFFKKNKEQFAMIISILTELLLLHNFLKRTKASELFIFNASESNTYFKSLFLDNNGIDISLVPSSNPISLYYKKVFCNTFIFTAPFQKIECEKLKHGWTVKSYKNWKPFGSNNITFNSVATNTPSKTIGFLSSAMKLRDILGHTNLAGNQDLKAELKLISSLKIFIEQHPDYSLTIFLHPLEKNSEKNLTICTEYYQEIFGKDVNFAPLDKSSKESFHHVDIGISSFSSSQIERLFGGYKVIFTPFDFLDNYYGDDRLNDISAKTEVDLFEMIEKISSLSAEEYLAKYNLQEYRWDNYV